MKINLKEYFENNTGDSIHKWNYYFDIYETHFRRFVGKKILMFEIGVDQGGSIKMRKDYFGIESVIVGIDINPDCKKYEKENESIFVEIGNQSDVIFLQSLIEKYGTPDIVLDDGSHKMDDLVNTFDFLYDKVKDNGVYMAEDLLTCYFGGYGGGINKPETFIEFVKAKIDKLNSGSLMSYLNRIDEIDAVSKVTQSINIYDGVIAFEKRLQEYKKDFRKP